MGKKNRRGAQQKTRTTLSLAEFTQDTNVGQDPELAALPSAPKLAEEWEAEGGRPEFNSRGYKERRVDPYAEDDTEFDNRDWNRRGPIDGPEAGGFGAGPERDWGSRRQGPLDGAGQPEREVDFGAVRRGPIEAEFGRGGRDVNFGVRRGPVDAEFPGAGRDVDFSMRKGPVEAEFGAHGGRDVDFGVRKGPVEAEFAGAGRDVDFSMRKGPVEAEFTSPGGRDVNFGVRKGPVEAEFDKSAPERDFSVRKGPIEAEFEKSAPERDFSVRKGPMDADGPSPARQVDFGAVRRGPIQAEKRAEGTSERDFANMRRGARLAAGEERQETERTWRRSEPPSGASEATTGMGRMAIGGKSGGAWRRGADAGEVPLRRNDAPPQRRERGSRRTPVKNDTDDEWTTVRGGDKKRGPIRRAQGETAQ